LETGRAELLGDRWLVNAFLDHAPIRDIAIYSDPANRFGRTIERPRVLRGQRPHRGAPDEIALNEQAADLLHVGPGARLTLRSWSAADLQQLFGGNSFPGFNGPVLHLRVVGVVRTLDGLGGDVERGSPYAFAGPGFLAAHPRLGAWPPALYVRARGGSTGFRAISRAVRGRTSASIPNGAGTTAGAAYLDGVQEGADGSAVGLLVFAAAAALAGGLVVGQSIQRHLATRATIGRQLVQLGLTRSATAGALTLPVATAALVGSLAGVVSAALTSSLLPIGVAGRAEPDPGIRVDVPVLVLCGLVSIALAGSFAFLWARARLTRVGPSPAPPRRVSVAVRAALGLGAPPAVTTGVQLAADRTSELGPVPLRTAFLGVALAVAAIVAAGVVVGSHDTLVNNPSRWGRSWDSEPDAFGDQTVDELAPRLARDNRIAAAARFSSGGFRIGSKDVTGYAIAPIRGQIAMTVLNGRLPVSADEIALGVQSLTDAHTRIGGRVRAKGQNGARATLRVTGTVVLPPSAGDAHELDLGAVTTRGTLLRLSGEENFLEDVVLRYPAGADVPRLERALRRDYGFEFNPFTEPQLPGIVRRLSDTRTVGIALAWFFGVLGLLSLVHALWVGTRRRSMHLTMLRVLGMRRVQVLAAVVIQAVLLVTVAIIVGIPVGLVVGRSAWRLTSEHLGAKTSPVMPWGVMGTVFVGALLGAVAVAWWPGYRIGRRPPATTLHVE
ncbi:MAG: ABC transporter permease, partial [Acidimicrobiia bacterium]|nr:ABC transporter permease [Acidimicrobiia bacterium]